MGAYSRLRESRALKDAAADEARAESVNPDGERPAVEAETSATPATQASLQGLVSNVGQRVQEIIDSAERIATDIRAEAEAASKSYLHDRQREADRAVSERLREFSTVTHSLAGKVERLQRETADLVEALEDARWRLADLAQLGSPTTGAPIAPAPPESAGKPGAAIEGGSSGEGERMMPEQAVLRATQMAVAGAERGEIEQMLRADFGVEDPVPVVDEMLRIGRAAS